MRLRASASLVLILVLAAPSLLPAQTPVRGSWDNVKAIQPGGELVVELRNTKTVKGRMGSATDTALTLLSGGKPTDIGRGDVLRLFWVTGRPRKKAVLIGMALGTGIGAGIGSTQVPEDRSEGETYPIYILGAVGAGVGALAGYLIGSGKERRLLYEVR